MYDITILLLNILICTGIVLGNIVIILFFFSYFIQSVIPSFLMFYYSVIERAKEIEKQ